MVVTYERKITVCVKTRSAAQYNKTISKTRQCKTILCKTDVSAQIWFLNQD